MNKEIWKPIPEYIEYEVSNLGRVRSLPRKHCKKIKILKPHYRGKERSITYCVVLCKNNKQKRFCLHRLVAEAFILNPENKRYVSHIDKNTKNNRVENLKWTNPKENNRLNIIGKRNANIKNRKYNKIKKIKTYSEKCLSIKLEENKEEWKTINGFNNYKISNFGRIKRLVKNKRNEYEKFLQCSFVKNKKGDKTYKTVSLGTGSCRTRMFYVHRLVAEHFVLNPQNKPCVNHKNFIKTDNRPENLEWVDYSENSIHCYESGKMEKNKLIGENKPASKLKEKQVKEIINLYSTGKYYYKNLAEKYKVSIATIQDIIYGKTWKYLI